MRVPLGWLREYVDLKDDAAAIARALTFAGVAVEAVEGDVLVLEITSNRADLLSMLGVARELALLRGGRVKPPPAELREGGPAIATAVEVADRALCPRYTARVVRGVKVGPAPAWMQAKLRAALGGDYAPVNNVADITNYVMLETGEPLHAFDLAKVRGNRIVVRRARAGEKMAAINGREYALQPEDLVIADAERPVAIAGVMGGKDSEIGDATRDVLIEAAMFDPGTVRRTSRRLGLASESSARFERGVDWDAVDAASRRAAQLIAELAGGTVDAGVVDVSVPRPEKPPVRVRTARVAKLLGMEVPAARIEAVLAGLGAEILGRTPEGFDVKPPRGRRDLNEEVDFIEEVARIEGYDRIPTDVQLGLAVAADNRDDLVREEIRTTLASLGAFEVLTWSFEEAAAKPAVTQWSDRPLLTLRNPKGHVDRTLRNALGPALEKVLRTNAGCGETLHPVFEIASVYYEGPDGQPAERMVAGFAHPGGPAEARAMARALFERLQVPFERLGEFGRLQGGTAELDFAKLAGAAVLLRRAKAYSSQPAVRRDLAMVFSKDVPWTAVEETVRRVDLPILREVTYLSHYEGPQVGDGKRSIALSLTFLAPDRTLTGAEVEAGVEKVASALAKDLGASRR